PMVQHFAYIEITPGDHQALWYAYEAVGKRHENEFAMAQIRGAQDIFPVFRELFARDRYKEAV
ncbi:MAG: DUF444 family protein, partial [Oleibacter sp.]|nr:DUF444 family protein [Thalassolituus sp.]